MTAPLARSFSVDRLPSTVAVCVKRTEAVGGNIQAARLTGIPVSLVLLFVYGVSGLLSGLAGVMSASRLYSASGKLGEGFELEQLLQSYLGEQASPAAPGLSSGL